MGKKVTIIVISAVLVLAVVAGTGFYLYSTTRSDINATESNKDSDSISNEVYLDEDMSGQDYIVDTEETQVEKETQYSDDFLPSDENLSDNTVDVITTNFTVERIVDHTTNEEVSGRVVFGKSFNNDENYINFDSNGNFEISLSGYLGKNTKGTYTEYGNIIYVEFEDGRAAEYSVKYTDDGIISYIIVNYGDYDVYFS